MKIYKREGKIIVEIDYWSKRSNSYMLDEDVGEYPTLTGLIVRNKGCDELGFAQTIDMDYKGKPDQIGDFIVKWHDGEDEFREKCFELGIGIDIIN